MTPTQANHQAPTAIQRLEFERTSSGAFVSLIGRADYDADTWLANFNKLKKIVGEIDGMPAKLSDEGLKSTYSTLQQFVETYQDAKITAAKRAEVGGANQPQSRGGGEPTRKSGRGK